MINYQNEIKILLDCLDTSVNSNTAWLHFELSTGTALDLQAFLLSQLETGHFHFALVKNDIIRGWDNYVRISYPEHKNNDVIRLLYPGTTWNGKTELDLQPISLQLARELIIDLLTGARKHFSISPSGTQMSMVAAERIVQDFLKCLMQNNSRELHFFQITPDFLWTVEESLREECNAPVLGYFENCNRDLALAILSKGKDGNTRELNLLLANGYC